MDSWHALWKASALPSPSPEPPAPKWQPPSDHPLARLHNAPLGSYRLTVLLGPKNAVGSRYFRLTLCDSEGASAAPDLAVGLFNTGPFPAYNWLELARYQPLLRAGDVTIDLSSQGLDVPLFRTLSTVVPPGGHLMVEYDSPPQAETARALALGYPPAVSQLGYLLFRAGCLSFRDWYICEGGREGPRKLQGFKPWNEKVAQEKADALRRDLGAFLARPASPVADLDATCRRRALSVLAALDSAG